MINHNQNYKVDKLKKINDIFNLIEIQNIYESKKIFFESIKTLDDMNLIILYAYENNKDAIGKQIIDFKFPLKRQNQDYIFSPFDFFCYVCKNDYYMILFRIIEDSYFWQKNNVIFVQEYQQTPKQWLISTSAYILACLNNVGVLKRVCDKYNITYFDAKLITIFDIAKKNNNAELTKFVNDHYLIYAIPQNSNRNILNEIPLYSLYSGPTLIASNEMYGVVHNLSEPPVIDSNINSNINSNQKLNKNELIMKTFRNNKM